jgi:hypothetical protein|tara:strand:- start:72 stop:299 length:228 start_codon:yes stop_codon:yes gene_type:complete
MSKEKYMAKLKKPPAISDKMSTEAVVQLVDWLDELQNMTQSMAKRIIEMRGELTTLTMVVKKLHEKVGSDEKTKH